MLRVITMTAANRPAYTREVLAALAKCNGIADWILLPNIEPGNEEVIAAFRQWDACEIRLVVNKKKFGLNRNTYETLFRAFKLDADMTVHLEDDTVPSPDALRYFDWAVREILIPDVRSSDGRHILLASAYNNPKFEPPPRRFCACQTRPIWTPWGWAVDRSRLNWLIIKWCFRNYDCFTCRFQSRYHRTHYEIYPVLSRIQNIGCKERAAWVAPTIDDCEFRLG